MELLSYINSMKDDSTIEIDDSILEITVRGITISQTREVQPVFTMGSFEPAMFNQGRTTYYVNIDTEGSIMELYNDKIKRLVIKDNIYHHYRTITIDKPLTLTPNFNMSFDSYNSVTCTIICNSLDIQLVM